MLGIPAFVSRFLVISSHCLSFHTTACASTRPPACLPAPAADPPPVPCSTRPGFFAPSLWPCECLSSAVPYLFTVISFVAWESCEVKITVLRGGMYVKRSVPNHSSIVSSVYSSFVAELDGLHKLQSGGRFRVCWRVAVSGIEILLQEMVWR